MSSNVLHTSINYKLNLMCFLKLLLSKSTNLLHIIGCIRLLVILDDYVRKFILSMHIPYSISNIYNLIAYLNKFQIITFNY